jgi:hypothetical protein
MLPEPRRKSFSHDQDPVISNIFVKHVGQMAGNLEPVDGKPGFHLRNAGLG